MLSDIIGAVILMAYYLLVCVLLPTLTKALWGVKTEIVRKTQHVAYSLSIFLLLRLFSAWYIAVAAAMLLVLLAYPILILVEKSAWYRRLFVDRSTKGGELRRQLLYVQLSFAILLFIFWGLLGTSWHHVVAASVMAWGFGDAAAALVGKAFGKTHFLHVYIEKSKTLEGTAAMITTAAVALFLTLLIYAGIPWHVCLVAALLVAPWCGVVELFSRRGLDTLTVPLATAFLLQPLLSLFAFFGW